ncbi:MAG: hypothetical protein RL481_1854 [Pseudomonadota bacterium]|jgi:hypothetical protein
MADERSSNREITLALIAAAQAIILGVIGYWSITPKPEKELPQNFHSEQIVEKAPLVGFSYVSTDIREDKSPYLIDDCENDIYESVKDIRLDNKNHIENGIISAEKNSIKIRFACVPDHKLIAISTGYADAGENREFARLILKDVKLSLLRQFSLTKKQRDIRDGKFARESTQFGDAAAVMDAAAAASSAADDAAKTK